MDPISYVEFLKTSGNQDFKNGSYALAIRKYDQAILTLMQYHHLKSDCHKDLAVLLCNKSNAFYNLEKWPEAYYTAQQSIQEDPSYFKGYYRAGHSLLKLDDRLTALALFHEGLNLLRSSSDRSQIADFIVGIFLSVTVNDEYWIRQPFEEMFEDILKHRYGAQVWQAVLEKLAKKGMWQACLLLVSKKNKLPMDLKVAQLSLEDIFKKYVSSGQYDRMETMPELVKWLITIGAKTESIGTCPLHAIMRLCIKAKDSSLFKWLLKHQPSMNGRINQQDGDGCTVLHVVASYPTTSRSSGYTVKRQTEDVLMLLGFDVDPSIPDSQSRCAGDLLKKNKNFKAEDLIKKHLARQTSSSSLPAGPPDEHERVSSEDEGVSLLTSLEHFSAFCQLEKRNPEQLANFMNHEKVRGFLKLLASVKEIPPEAVCDISDFFANHLVTQLLHKQKWHEVLLLLSRNASRKSPDGTVGGLLKNCHLPDLNIGSIISQLSTGSKQRIQLLKCLLDRGAPPDGFGASCEKPLCICLKKEDFELAYLLLSQGADPQSLSFVEGDTPLHAAVSISLNKKDDIGLHILSHLLDLYSSKPDEFPYLEPNIQNKQGNSVMHVLFQGASTKQNNAVSIKKIMDLLAKFDINLTLKNKLGKDVRHRIKKNDPRLLMWNKAVSENKKKHRQDVSAQPVKPTKPLNSDAIQSKMPPHSSSPASLPSAAEPQGDAQKIDLAVIDTERAVGKQLSVPELREPDKALTLRECLVHIIACLIQQFVLCKPLKEDIFLIPKPPLVAATEEVKNRSSDGQGTESSPSTGTADNDINMLKGDDVDNTPGRFDLNEDGEPDGQNEDADDLANIQDFDSMTWEIECTSDALKKLGSKAVPHHMKKKIVLIVQQLGNGEWVQSLQKRLKYLKSDIQLYEAKLDKGARILWELAIDFSPRCSEDLEKIIETEQSVHPVEASGRVYTEIIRIWDIVLDHNKLNHAIDNICSAYNRGLTCILRKKLKGINKTQLSSNLSIQKRIPRCYIEDIDYLISREPVLPDYFPPASAVETEYNIMKFHSFSTTMAFNIISDMNSPVEYPFRVGELEYAVIDLNPKPLEAIILIGRSGTGKTTCCLYRLWKKFHSYWEKAEEVGGPWLAKQTWQRRKLRTTTEIENTEEEDDIEEADEDEESVDELETQDSIDDEQDEEDGPQFSCDNEGEDNNNSIDESEMLEHFHQIFITKNHVLCQEVQRNFIELSKSTKATSLFKPVEPNVYLLQDLKDENFPLFVTSKQLLLLLDASMPDPYFPRNEDGSLKRNIVGWSTQDELVISGLLDDEEGDVEGEYAEEENASESHAKETDPRVFVTHEVFSNEIWPKMVKGKHAYNPALVWKEIKSFLKGSFEALSCIHGMLTEDQYIKLGRKRAPNFQGDRKEVYRLFCIYQQIKSQRGYFDEEDVLYNLSQRLSKLDQLPWSIHELYGDEIQDFTQAELALLMRTINDPNSMFLTGDTAQSIMKGVSFRFSDLRSLFHYASKNCANDKKYCAVRKPKRIYQLYQNYRSHSGILRLASGVVDLLQCYFPESFDRLPRDCGLFDGPKPTVLESCSISDLAILLKGNRRKTQPIEFGAHQVILVANEIVKDKIPEELSLALVLTIYEAKGLEFDDVLLYNFFTDSEAGKEWRVISSFIPPSESTEENKPLIEVPLEKNSAPHSRPLALNADMHKMLNGELKQLYTAITRARVNLWIFDENCEKRAPAFEYFIKREFVKVVTTNENEDLDDSMFVKTSTAEEWIAQGEYYAKHQCWKVAAKCYQKGGASEKEKLALAHDAVLNVQSKKCSPKEKQMEYMELAKTYLECREPRLALKCLAYAKEFQLCAELCEKLGKAKDAAYFYKRIQHYRAAARCFEQVQEFELALKMYCQEKMYEEAAHALERYERVHPDTRLPYTTNQFYLEAAAKYLSASKMKEMNEVLSKLDTEDQLTFLKSRKCWTQAADLLKSKGREEEAAYLMRQHGDLLGAAKLTSRKEFRASCLLAAARLGLTGCEINMEEVLMEAQSLCWEVENLSGYAEATLLLGILKNNSKDITEAFRIFSRINHNVGAVEALFEYAHCNVESSSVLSLAAFGLTMLISLVKALQRATTNAEKEMVKSCFEFFGILQVDNNQCHIQQKEGARILQHQFDTSHDLKEKKNKDGLYCLDVEDVKFILEKHLLRRLCFITQKVMGQVYPDICTKFIVGLDCQNNACEDFHRPVLRHEAKSMLSCKSNLATVSGLLLEAKRVFRKELSNELKEIENILTADEYSSCKSLLEAFFPKHFHLRILSENTGACKEIRDFKNSFPKPCKMVLNEYISSLFKHADNVNRRESTDLWLNAMRVFVLSSHYPASLENLFAQEEHKYNKEYRSQEARNYEKDRLEKGRGDGRRTKGIEGRYGMVLPDKSEENPEVSHICFFRLLQSSIDYLYVHKNPESCKWLFYRFMNMLVKKCILPLIPSIGNTVMLLEFQFILCCAVLMRLLKNVSVCLPKSYIALLHYWEFMFGKKDKGMVVKDTYSILWEYKPKDVNGAASSFKYHLSYLAKVLCGVENEMFNVLLDSFSDIDYITSGEAERTVVLCLVMLVNVNRVLNPECKSILRSHFPEIKFKLMEMKEKFPSRVPERLIKVVARVTETTDTGEIVNCLQELLIERDDEHLFECHWKWETTYGKGAVRGIFYEKVNQEVFGSLLYSDENFEEPEMEQERDFFAEQKDDPLVAIASKVQQKASAKKRLDYLFRLVCSCIKWKRVLRTKIEPAQTEMENSVPASFKKADVDRTQCDICGVKFVQNPRNFFIQSEELEANASEAGTLPKTDLEEHDIMESNETQIASESYENHIALEQHKRNSTAYKKYLDFFKSHVDLVLCEGKEVVQNIIQAAEDHLESKEQSNLEQKKIQDSSKKIMDKVEDIYKKKAWADAEEQIMVYVKKLITNIGTAHEWLKKTAGNKTKKDAFKQDCDFENDFEEGFDELCRNKKNLRRKKKNKRR
ncbi:TPR and ankyrin repeat-containing protein 1 [Rhinatrema bivittatum]|uniref:TPR and ankyrin repeat-containing protein 1 n=1 Tax=Rhinatrema bivittatum TaxID=194408 RepID=UPI00112CA46C|nr:TPR and ankyrin repeat-containing protein 1 [Rhinatrema bivittatum]XP_029445567.1 TPR and ankyrin repeat-containing protein 1 [Rhinatrema bivittatum]XP_029445568.1 TPR and ankyrin repeat-containing protein 1 [Rhinatrema bivittatum]